MLNFRSIEIFVFLYFCFSNFIIFRVLNFKNVEIHTLKLTWQSTLADLSNYQPTQFQPVGLCKKSTGNQPRSYLHIGAPTGDSWFSWNQPSFQPCALTYEGWKGVGFCKTNRHSNYRLWYTKVGTRLVLAKPTAGFPILYEDWKSVGFGLIFCTKQLSTVEPVREGISDRSSQF